MIKKSVSLLLYRSWSKNFSWSSVSARGYSLFVPKNKQKREWYRDIDVYKNAEEKKNGHKPHKEKYFFYDAKGEKRQPEIQNEQKIR